MIILLKVVAPYLMRHPMITIDHEWTLTPYSYPRFLSEILIRARSLPEARPSPGRNPAR